MRSDLLDKALETLKLGGTLLYPTDTIWGIGCDACCHEAVEKIYALKERDLNKSMLVLVNERMLSSSLPSKIWELLLHSEKPTTIILPREMLSTEIAENLSAKDGSVGVRVPRFDFCEALLKALEKPIVSTSANLSGRPSPSSYMDIDEIIKERVDYALPNDKTFFHPQTGSSRIIKIENGGALRVIRE